MRPPARRVLAEAAGQEVPADSPPQESPIGDGVVVLRHVHRYGGSIGRIAEAIQRGDGDGVVALLAAGEADACWIPIDVAAAGAAEALGSVRTEAVACSRRLVEAARAGRAGEAIAALAAFRLLCAHRRGPEGVSTWMPAVERWLATEIDGFAREGTWYAGRPLLVTENDYSLRLYNGDTGVVVASGPGRVVAAFERSGEIVEISPTRLASVDTVYAMTVHKAQGSQFDTVAVLLPSPDSPILTRELLYTAVTRAQRRLFVAGSEESVRAAVARPIARASGLQRSLWGA
jgi:exodeoxyribonuclease V alpha subunit